MKSEQSRDVRAVPEMLALGGMALLIRLNEIRFRPWSSGDSPEYLVLAKNILSHHVFSLDASGQSLLPTAKRPPLYPALIASLWWGEAPPTTTVMLLQAVLGAATVAIVYLMARDYFSRKVAVLAAAGMALAPMSSHYTAVILTETLFTFFITCGFFLWGRKRGAWAGLFFGLGVLTRPTMFPFFVLLPLLSLLPWWRSLWRTHVLIVIVALAVSSIWIVRNAVVFGRLIPVAASGWGTNLFVGTIETQFSGDDVWTAILKDPALLAAKEEVTGLDETATDKFLMRRAIQRIKESPGRWLKLRAKQYPRLFIDSGDYWLGSSNTTFGAALRERRPLVILTKLAFVLGNLLVFALAAFGLYKERARFVQLSHLILFPLFLLLAQLPMWIEARYSLPVMPAVVIFAAVGALRLASALGQRGGVFKTAAA